LARLLCDFWRGSIRLYVLLFSSTMVRLSILHGFFCTYTSLYLGDFKYPELIPPEGISFSKVTPILDGEDKQLFIRFAKRMLQWDPECRATARELCDDPWLDYKGWNNLVELNAIMALIFQYLSVFLVLDELIRYSADQIQPNSR
jgi:serine/threonine protein kinase